MKAVYIIKPTDGIIVADPKSWNRLPSYDNCPVFFETDENNQINLIKLEIHGLRCERDGTAIITEPIGIQEIAYKALSYTVNVIKIYSCIDLCNPEIVLMRSPDKVYPENEDEVREFNKAPGRRRCSRFPVSCTITIPLSKKLLSDDLNPLNAAIFADAMRSPDKLRCFELLYRILEGCDKDATGEALDQAIACKLQSVGYINDKADSTILSELEELRRLRNGCIHPTKIGDNRNIRPDFLNDIKKISAKLPRLEALAKAILFGTKR